MSKFEAFHGNGDVSILVKNSRVRLKTTNKQTKQELGKFSSYFLLLVQVHDECYLCLNDVQTMII